MEKFKSIEELTQIDRKHLLMSSITGLSLDLALLHENLSKETLNEEVPDELKSQFNIAKNMALYTYYFYALAPEVHLKTYTVIEHALRVKADTQKHLGLRKLLEIAVKKGWICDAGFRHLDTNEPGNKWCTDMIDVIPQMRNLKAHGSNMLVWDFLNSVAICSDFLNQLFPKQADKDSV
ncbi:hypothetical protein C0J08_15225 [Marinomonas sp. CT5]|uniref:hypothetical protein n=1 Tax=Marinomonas sp. CT5 TaxID=2066133 RepID=UPI001BAEDBD1|nr:hypothetical protein [Marinomonas sp. CT5]QUX96665.1 hypothetical protein C0J08_15225 [Marinomonas sp. CT5]